MRFIVEKIMFWKRELSYWEGVKAKMAMDLSLASSATYTDMEWLHTAVILMDNANKQVVKCHRNIRKWSARMNGRPTCD